MEATDEAFVRACERWGRVSTTDAPGAWVQVVALNVVRRRMRRRPPLTATARVADGALPDPDLWAAVRRLPRRQREVVVLRYVADWPEADIAASLGISRGTVASTLSDARGVLRAVLDDPAGRRPSEEVARG